MGGVGGGGGGKGWVRGKGGPIRVCDASGQEAEAILVVGAT